MSKTSARTNTAQNQRNFDCILGGGSGGGGPVGRDGGSAGAPPGCLGPRPAGGTGGCPPVGCLGLGGGPPPSGIDDDGGSFGGCPDNGGGLAGPDGRCIDGGTGGGPACVRVGPLNVDGCRAGGGGWIPGDEPGALGGPGVGSRNCSPPLVAAGDPWPLIFGIGEWGDRAAGGMTGGGG